MNNTEFLNVIRYIADSNKSEKINNIDKKVIKKNVDVYCISVPGTAFTIKHDDKISVTGNCHCDGLMRLFREFCSEHPKIITDEFKKTIYDYARQTYDLEERFIDLAYELGDVKGLTKEEVKEYIKYLIDRRLISMGLRGNFEVKVNPLPWIDELLGTKEHANFFETSVTDYQKGGISGSWADAW